MAGELPHEMQQVAPVRILRTQPVPQLRCEVLPTLFLKHTGILQNTGQEAHQPPGEHLPRRPWALSEDEVADKACQRAGEKACLRPKGYRCNDDNSRAGLEVWQWDNREYCAPHNGNSRHDRDRHQLTGLGLLLIEYQYEGDGGRQQEQQAQQNIRVQYDVVPESAGTHRIDRGAVAVVIAEGHHQGGQHQKDHPRGGSGSFADKELRHDAITSSQVMSMGKCSAAIRLASVV